MPELPEVETIVRSLHAADMTGRTVLRARVLWDRSIASPSSTQFKRQIKNKTIGSLSRRGKYIVMTLSDGWTALCHLRMSGRLFLQGGKGSTAHDRVILTLDDNRELRFLDPRKFGRWWLTKQPENVLCKLGPEPLDDALDKESFRDRVKSRRKILKALLLDQSFVAGIGNIYADEIMWKSYLYPLRKADSLHDLEIDRLYNAMREILQKGIENLGTSLGDGAANFRLPSGEEGRNRENLHVYGQTGLTCTRCTHTIRSMKVAQRTTHYCPSCQFLKG